MKRKYLFYIATLALVLFMFGCEKQEEEQNNKQNNEQNNDQNIWDESLLGNLGDVKFSTPGTPQGFAADISAVDLAAGIKIGWNLGNTLDAHPGGETYWGNPLTTKAMITAIKDAGFNAIRIPVSWYQSADKDYNISESRMKRVVEIVNYAVDNDMYIVLNTHHDEHIFKFLNKDIEESKRAFRKIWGQISYVFRNYNEKLIFEGLNEPRTKDSPKEWQGGTAEEHGNLNAMHQLFTDVVRTSGGNNDKRVLMVSTYAASAESAAMNGLVIPDDPANTVNKFIVSIHSYSPYNFALDENKATSRDKWNNDTSQINDWLNRANTKFVKNGFPVIGGEFGALDRDNEAERAAWAEYYVRYAKSKDIKCFWWDDGGKFKLFNRNNLTFYFPSILEALMKGVE